MQTKQVADYYGIGEMIDVRMKLNRYRDKRLDVASYEAITS